MSYEHHDRVEEFQAIAEAEGEEDAAEALMRGVAAARGMVGPPLVSISLTAPRALVDYLVARGITDRDDLATRALQLLVVELESGRKLAEL
jgi:hypothetical protein